METTNEKREQPDLQEVRQQLSQIPGVVSVGIGFKEVGGITTEEVSFRVYVREKKKESDLLPEHVIPAEIKGAKTDVTVVPIRRPLADEKRYRPIKGGTKVRNGNCKTACFGALGTFGCLATLNVDNSVVLLSNWHVLNSFGASKGDEIGQPGRCCCCCFKDVIAHITDGKYGDKVDCAIAKVKSDVPLPTDNIVRALGGKDPNGKDLDGTIQGLAPLQRDRGQDTSLKVGDPVKKVGVSSGLTEGEVKEIFMSVQDDDGEILHDQIDVKPLPGKKFAEEGDSGSVLLTANNEVAGLLWAGTDDGIGTANEIRNVISVLNISFPKTLPTPSTPTPPPSPPLSPSPSPLPSRSAQPSSSPLPPSSLIAGGTPVTVRINQETDVAEVVAFERDLLRKYENEFRQTSKGARFISLAKDNMDEVLSLVNHNRPVMVTWRRKQGPAFLAAFAGAEDPHYKVPKEINGVSLESMLTNMAVVLEEYGSDRLRQALKEVAVDVLVYAKECDSLAGLLERMRQDQ